VTDWLGEVFESDAVGDAVVEQKESFLFRISLAQPTLDLSSKTRE